MKRFLDRNNNFGTVWYAETANFRIRLFLTEEQNYQYDGDDCHGETQDALNAGELVAFSAVVTVENNDGLEIGFDSLGGCVYKDGETAEFLDSGYFADMVQTACTDARATLAALPKLRA